MPLLFATPQAERKPVNVLDPQEEEAFLQRCKTLCDERNLKLEKVKNARDLSSVKNSPVQPGRIYRMGRVSDATDEDLQLLREQLNIHTLVDLRSPTELKDDPTLMREAVFQNYTDILWKEQGRKSEGCLRELPKGEGPVRRRRGGFWNRNKHADDAPSDDLGDDATTTMTRFSVVQCTKNTLSPTASRTMTCCSTERTTTMKSVCHWIAPTKFRNPTAMNGTLSRS